jgi:hypothetical protein
MLLDPRPRIVEAATGCPEWMMRTSCAILSLHMSNNFMISDIVMLKREHMGNYLHRVFYLDRVSVI